MKCSFLNLNSIFFIFYLLYSFIFWILSILQILQVVFKILVFESNKDWQMNVKVCVFSLGYFLLFVYSLYICFNYFLLSFDLLGYFVVFSAQEVFSEEYTTHSMDKWLQFEYKLNLVIFLHKIFPKVGGHKSNSSFSRYAGSFPNYISYFQHVLLCELHNGFSVLYK